MKNLFLVIGTIFLIILFLVSVHFKEGLGFDNDPSQFSEPSIYPDFITEDDANYILEKAAYNYTDSTVVGSKADGIRKSETYWLSKEDEVAKKIINKVCQIDGNNTENAEDIQVVKYQPNGYYREHHDSCCEEGDKCNEFNKEGNRILTMVIYLNDDFDGGSTRFPNLDKDFKPKKYSGILFYPMNKKGDKCHDNSLHAGMPITSGEKYIANVWIRDKHFR